MTFKLFREFSCITPLCLAVLLFCDPLAGQSLRQLADQEGIRIGAAVAPQHLAEEAYAATLAREFNQVQAENATKFGPIHPARDSYNFAPADTLAAFTREHQMAMRGHTLVWHRQNPRWLTQGDFKPAELAAILQEHIKTVMGHFAGQLYAWDVVNEAFNDDGTLRHTIWSDGLGPAYIEQALRWAHEADPKALLFYNDYSAEAINSKSDVIYKMAQDFKTRGVPLGGIGLQMHLRVRDAIPFESMAANLKRLTDLGLQVQITELDVRLPVDASGVASRGDLGLQSLIYRGIALVCLGSARCTALQTWGFTDKYSWIPGEYPGFGAALLFDANYAPKASYNAFRDPMVIGIK